MVTVRRGMEWIKRLTPSERRSVGVPESLIGVAGSLDPEIISPWRAPYFWAYRPLIVDPEVGSLYPVTGDCAEVQHLQCQGALLVELVSGLIRGFTIVARRSPTIDLLLEAGIMLRVHGARYSADWFSSLSGELSQEHLAALDRRTRFMIRNMAYPYVDGELKLLVCDRGRDAWH